MKSPTVTCTGGSARGSATPPRLLPSASRECPPVIAMFPPQWGLPSLHSYFLGAFAITVHVTGDTSSCQILLERWSPPVHLSK